MGAAVADSSNSIQQRIDTNDAMICDCAFAIRIVNDCKSIQTFSLIHVLDAEWRYTLLIMAANRTANGEHICYFDSNPMVLLFRSQTRNHTHTHTHPRHDTTQIIPKIIIIISEKCLSPELPRLNESLVLCAAPRRVYFNKVPIYLQHLSQSTRYRRLNAKINLWRSSKCSSIQHLPAMQAPNAINQNKYNLWPNLNCNFASQIEPKMPLQVSFRNDSPHTTSLIASNANTLTDLDICHANLLSMQSPKKNVQKVLKKQKSSICTMHVHRCLPPISTS